MDEDPLGLDPETMRRLGYQAVDLLVDRWVGLRAQPVLRRGTPMELARRLSGPPPTGPQSFERILEQLDSDVLEFISNNDHPGYFAYVPGSGTWPGILGDLIASACNLEASSWVPGAGPSQLELVVLEVVVERWDATREFYVVVDGTAVVRTAERHLDDIGPGDFFGEIAALDWGASFGYARLATVTATSPMRLLVLASADLLVLMDEIPEIGAQVSRAARDRLPGL